MARLYTDFPLSGTFGNLTVYQVGNKSYVRTKSRLDRKRFYKDPAFAKSREKAVLFGAAARLVKGWYATLPKEVKRHGLFGKLTALAYKALQEELSTTLIMQELKAYVGLTPTMAVATTPLAARKTKGASGGNKPTLSTWKVTASGQLQATATSLPVKNSPCVRVLMRLPDG